MVYCYFILNFMERVGKWICHKLLRDQSPLKSSPSLEVGTYEVSGSWFVEKEENGCQGGLCPLRPLTAPRPVTIYSFAYCWVPWSLCHQDLRVRNLCCKFLQTCFLQDMYIFSVQYASEGQLLKEEPIR